jgi:hypothetical protein
MSDAQREDGKMTSEDSYMIGTDLMVYYDDDDYDDDDEFPEVHVAKPAFALLFPKVAGSITVFDYRLTGRDFHNFLHFLQAIT